jgi:hypothetical protein
MNEIDHFKVFVLCSGDVAIDVEHVKRIHLVDFSYIVIEDLHLYLFLQYYRFNEVKDGLGYAIEEM